MGRNAEDLPLDESSERAPLRPNGSSNENGEARLLDNGFAVVPATESMTMQEFNSPSEHAGIGKQTNSVYKCKQNKGFFNYFGNLFV